VDRESIARAERRRQALEALEFERSRAAALRERLEAIVVELDGPAIDASIFAELSPQDVEIVRPALQGDEAEPVESFELDLEGGDRQEEHAAWLEEEVARLEQEIVASGSRQQAFERYLDALDRVQTDSAPPT
jgi:ABC-type oligopeptide transport system substrate-binding subunit